ncbi:MAG: cell division protein FtsQ/DivIB, partial [Gammaproteobacteria bacterium]|nr:cell division protein FtsQ/DivIB [Gammaproteobacteria bacterium]
MNCPRVLFGVSHHVLCALLLLLMMPSVQAANDPNRASDLRYMMILGDVGEGERDQIRRVVLAMEDALNDIDEVRAQVEGLSWVAAAEVQFNWPDELTIRVHPERAIAYWNESAFINKEGIAFQSRFHAGIDLPHLYGPEDQVDEVMRRYLEIRRALPDFLIEMVEVRARGAVAFELRAGWQVLLGSNDVSERLQRSVVVISRLERMGVDPTNTRIDARYTDGVAINGPIPT